MIKNQDRKNKNLSGRLNFSLVIVFVLGLLLISRLVYLQVMKGQDFSFLSDRQHQFSQEVLAPRGRISATSKDGRAWPLAMNRVFYEIYAVPKDLLPEEAEKLALAMSTIFEETEITEASSSSFWWRLTKEGDPYEVLQKKVEGEKLLELYGFLFGVEPQELKIESQKVKKGEEVLLFKGLGFENRSYRYYPEFFAGSHFLGFVNYENQGTYGLEQYYNQELSGQKGWLSGTRFSSRVNKANPGQDLYLSIDKALQYKACQILSQGQKDYKYSSATMIVVNPENGDILAMCSEPSFDPNNYNQTSEQSVFHNPATDLQYEPGSVIKVLTLAAAIDQGKLTPETTYEDRGQVMINGWPKAIRNSDFESYGPHGTTDMKTVLDLSLNTGAIFAMQKIGAVTFSNYIQKFGLGKKTGIDLPGEIKGDIRNLQKDKIKEIEAVTASFGQGIAVTPLQVLMAYASLANDGLLMEPRLVTKRISEDGKVYEYPAQEVGRVVSEKTAKTMLAMLTSVVENGHSKRAAVSGYYVGGKTGTAQIPSPQGGYLSDQYIHTFVGLGPTEDPKFAIIVKVDKPQGYKFAESTAAPMFSQMADFLINYYHLPKTR